MQKSVCPSQTAVLYARVSSKDQEREGFSIPAQQRQGNETGNWRGAGLCVLPCVIPTMPASGFSGW